ncbi:MAG: hypothetical protein HC882_05820 [Acidobacteria bacterium]|nr:hypothetical protein [Acidobacteriota bacterium]
MRVDYVDDAANGVTDGAKDTRLTWSAPLESAWGLETAVVSFEVYGSSTTPAFRAEASTLLATRPVSTPFWTHELAPASPKNWYYTVVGIDANGLRSPASSAFPESVSDLRLRVPDGSPATLELRWTGVEGGLNGAPGPAIEKYNLYGRPSLLPRAECSDANRLATFGSLGRGQEHVFETPLTSGAFVSYQLLSQDYKGTEAVW